MSDPTKPPPREPFQSDMSYQFTVAAWKGRQMPIEWRLGIQHKAGLLTDAEFEQAICTIQEKRADGTYVDGPPGTNGHAAEPPVLSESHDAPTPARRPRRRPNRSPKA